MDLDHQKFLSQLKQATDNQYCFQCGENSTLWASVNNGIFICLKCAGVHRGLGVNISFVRSVTLDSWNQNQLLLMKRGGNQRLAQFLSYYGISKDASPQYKYNTKAMTYYRQLLKSQVEMKEHPQAPAPLQAVKRQPRLNRHSFPNQQQAKQQNRDSLEQGKQKIAQLGNKALNGLQSIYQKGKEKYNQTDFKQLAINTKNKISQKIDSIDTQEIKQKGKRAAGKAKQYAQVGLQYGKIGAQVAWNKISSLWS